jgi:hypothetical protein
MSVSVVPASFQTPLVRPRRNTYDVDTPEGFAAYTESLHFYDLEVARRLAYANMKKYAPEIHDNDDVDVVVDVGGTGVSLVWGQPQVVRRLGFDQEYEGDDEFLSDYESEDTEYEDNSDVESFFEEENPLYQMEYKEEKILQTDLEESMKQDCPLCLVELKRAECVTTSCKHNFCVECYEQYKKKSSCPCCRQTVNSLTRYYAM